jgi:hypothetical protein
MTTTDIRKIKDKDIRGSYPALQRAARAARQLAAQTHTRIYVWQNGQVVGISPHVARSRRKAA